MFPGLIKTLKNGILIYLLILPALLFGQNRGNALGFQGIDGMSEPVGRVAGLAGAFSAVSGDVNALYYNPAGLSGLDKIQLQISGNGFSGTWWENQVYRPNRRFFTLPFYLEGLYVPDPANNGRWDHEVFFEGLDDTAYVVSLPDTGLEHYSKDAADWKHELKETGLSDVSLAVPLTVLNRKVTLAAGIRPQVLIQDYDRNETWLDPHISYIEYDMFEQVDGSDTLRMNWYDFERSRKGNAMTLHAGIGIDLLPWLSAGFSAEYLSGETDDYQIKDKIGYFDLFYENQFMYSYDTLRTVYEGTSQFNTLKSRAGVLFNKEKVSFGITVYLPYTVTREFSYDKSVTDTLGTVTTAVSGSEEMKVPAGYTLGLAIKPVDRFLFSLDISQLPYDKTEWTFSDKIDGEKRTWVKQKSLRFGMEFIPCSFFVLRGGYSVTSQVFIPDGAPRVDKGPDQVSWTLGTSIISQKMGSLDIAYVMRNLKYYDQYFSNTNYMTHESNRWILAYTVKF